MRNMCTANGNNNDDGDDDDHDDEGDDGDGQTRVVRAYCAHTRLNHRL